MGKYFDDLHESKNSQLLGGSVECADTAAISSLRNASDYDGYIALGNELSKHLRYREATEIYAKALLERPDSIEALFLYGGKSLSSLQCEQAYSAFTRAHELHGDLEHISYRMGVCCYYLGKYDEGMDWMNICFPLCNDEMGIAVIYWHTLCAYRAGKEAVLLQKFREDMQIGHHTAYNKAVRVFVGLDELDSALKCLFYEIDELEYVISAYGLCAQLEKDGRDFERRINMKLILKKDSLWPLLAYLAAFNDDLREKSVK